MKSKLIVEYNYDFTLCAISSNAKDYQLAWLINRQLGVDLVKRDDLLLEFKNGGRVFFSNFEYNTNTGLITLLKNKSEDFSNIANPFLLSDLKTYDYLLKVEGEVHEMTAESLVTSLKNVNKIQFVTTVVPENLKFKENLIF